MSGERGQGGPQAPSPGRRLLVWLDYGFSYLVTGKPPIPVEEQRRNQMEFMRMTREMTEIAVLVTLLWAVAGLTAYLYLPPALPPILGWGTFLVAFFWFLKISQIVLNRRRLRPWRSNR